jgi:hypothetical protein
MLSGTLAPLLDRIHQAESQAIQENANENVISAKIVFHLLHQLDERRDVLGDQPCTRVISELAQSLQDDDNSPIFKLGRRYLDHLICACTFSYFSVFFIQRSGCFQVRIPDTGYSTPSPDPSPPPSYNTLKEMIKDFVEAAGKDYKTSKRKVRFSTLRLLYSAVHA